MVGNFKLWIKNIDNCISCNKNNVTQCFFIKDLQGGVTMKYKEWGINGIHIQLFRPVFWIII